MNTGSFVAGAGVVAVLGGLAALAGFVVPGLNVTFVFVTVVGLVAGVQGLRYALGRRNVDYRATDTGNPELRYRVPTPGDDADRRAGSADGWRGSGASNLRARLREAAVESLVLHDNCSPEAAEAHVDEGTWTDDPIAARYLGADVPLSWRRRLSLLVRRQSSAPARVARTVAAVEAIHDGDGSVAERRREREREREPEPNPASNPVEEGRA
ncbi:hypothetical protein NDI76_04950 [Halogeometricum sp. S1BR25-6]|uniref:Uncharacterized protein n=1 Tax=Halogeometricum salsisoli TaxID=2950536 RepID=A0ABU2GBA0_9EURY|nr:hypothetical protein [Halogeometricum sp. S1BR25-6]MDS0298082.1 hypothetical protein [Halogeometricum sp. S1BR25-6]